MNILNRLQSFFQSARSVKDEPLVVTSVCECGSEVIFYFRDVPMRQTIFKLCDNCREMQRMVLTSEQRAEPK
jgi:hypothetical protein